MKPNWVITPKASDAFFRSLPDISSLAAQALWNRNIRNSAQAQQFLRPDPARDFHDPFLFGEMPKAVDRIFKALESGEKIAIWGDYDCDGICGTAVLYTLFSDMGYAHALNVHIPDRNLDGYGVSMPHLKELHSEGITLVITVDCGITSRTEIAWAQGNGMDVIVADHHSVPEILPPAHAILNPKDPKSGYPFYGLAGTGVAYKLATAILSHNKKKGYGSPDTEFLDLVALATLADSMPLRDENRVIVSEGFAQLAKKPRPGLRELFSFCGLTENFTVRDMHFSIIPRLNAMGRMEHASTSFRLLTTDNPDEAAMLIRHMDVENRRRQLAVEVIANYVRDRLAIAPSDAPAVFEVIPYGAVGRVPGILGLAANTIMQEIKRPVVLAITDEKGERATGNARALGTFDIIKALRSRSELFIDVGGHPHAGGFTAEAKNLDMIRELVLKTAQAVKDAGGFSQEDAVAIDAELSLDDVTPKTYRDLQQLWPFGEENPEPRFLFRQAPIERLRAVGNANKHLKLRLGGVDAIAFGFGDKAGELHVGDRLNTVASLSENTWNGKKSIELNIIDLVKS
ncbi:MAG: single-stranded-DNA-specific exonuclease RecJ [bacterium]|nr:single-stranded-DNA-specific exonuclease RecJ [bacterium]